MKLRKGFTLIELLVVVAIIGILVTIAVPRFQTMTGGAKDAAAQANHRQIVSAVSMYIAAHQGKLPERKSDLNNYLPVNPNDPTQDGIDYLQDQPAGAVYAFENQDGQVSITTTLDTKQIAKWVT